MRGGIDFVREQTDPSAQRQRSKVGRSPEAGRVRGKGRSLPLKYILRPLTMGREVLLFRPTLNIKDTWDTLATTIFLRYEPSLRLDKALFFLYSC